MARTALVACVQPPYLGPDGPLSPGDVVESALELLQRAGQRGADIACLPEYLNVMNAPPQEAAGLLEPLPGPLSDEVGEIARAHAMHVVLPIAERRGDSAYNTAAIVDADGEILGTQEKTHLTRVEREDLGITAGDSYRTFDLPWCRAGTMVCYDGHFPEVARILALKGAEIIFFPSLQRRLGERKCAIQVAARAMDNGIYVARSSYGVTADVAWDVEMMYGLSCIVGPQGDTRASCGRYAGLCMAEIDFGNAPLQARSAGDAAGDLRTFIREDRRPDTYGELVD